MRVSLRTLWRRRRRIDWQERHRVSIGVSPACRCGHPRTLHKKLRLFPQLRHARCLVDGCGCGRFIKVLRRLVV